MCQEFRVPWAGFKQIEFFTLAGKTTQAGRTGSRRNAFAFWCGLGNNFCVNKVSTPPHTVLYDGDCSLCTFQMRLLTWLDWFNTIRFVPISHPEASVIAPEIRREDLLEAIHCVAADGRIYRGARAFRFVGMRLPLLVPIALILWLPGVIWLAESSPAS